MRHAWGRIGRLLSRLCPALSPASLALMRRGPWRLFGRRRLRKPRAAHRRRSKEEQQSTNQGCLEVTRGDRK